MRVWEAIQMLEQMDQHKEVIVTFAAPAAKSKNDNNITKQIVGPAYAGFPPTIVGPMPTIWRNNEWPKYPNQITCGTMQ